MIDERQEELAALYAFDQLEGDERTRFEADLARDPALQSLVRQFRETASTLAHTAAVKPPPNLKARVLATISTPSAQTPADNVIRPAASAFRTFLPWSLAACLALAAAGLGSLYVSERAAATRYRQQHALADVALQSTRQQLEAERLVTRRQLQDLDQQLATANTALAQARNQVDAAVKELDASKSQLASASTQSAERNRRLTDLEQQLSRARTQVAERERQVARLNERIDALTHASTDLSTQLDSAKAQVAKLTNDLQVQAELADFKITLLASMVPDVAQARAVAVWDPKKQEGVLKVTGLPPLTPAQDYQLWVVAPGYQDPLDGGVFTVDPKTGEQTLNFKTNQPATAVNAFAITREKKGGVPKSAGPMLLVGK